MTPGSPINLGLAEFIAQLARETFTSVVGAQLEQERHIDEIVGSATDEAAALRSVTDVDIDHELRAKFPDDQVGGGLPYVRPENGVDESPPFAAALGLTLAPGDSVMKNGTRVLTKPGVDHIRQHVRQQLAQRVAVAARRLIEQSVPRVRVTAGKIVAKVGLTAVATGVDPADDALWLEPPVGDPEGGPNPVKRPTLVSRAANTRMRSQLIADDLGGLRIIVAPAGQAGAEATPQLIGEIELSFSTVIP